jgi:nucleotide-binding universal stress UspA family protein
MKKIIVVLDGLSYSSSAVAYAVFISKQEMAHLVGVFLNDISYRSYALYDLVDESGVSDQRIRDLSDKDRHMRSKSVQQFELACQQAGLHYSVHKDNDIAIDALLHESIYADLMIIESKEAFNRVREEIPSHFLRHLMAEAVCPILIVPAEFMGIDKSIILYDGSPSSVYAIRMFDYTLPTMKYLPVEVISVKSPAASLHLPDGKLMKEFMKRHYPDATYQVLQGIPWEIIPPHLQNEGTSTVVVLGAYHRNRISRWFYPSMADTLLAELQCPLFIAHCK